MAKRAGRVGSDQSGHGLKRVIFKRINRITGQTGCRSNGSGQTGLTRFAMSSVTKLVGTKIFIYVVGRDCRTDLCLKRTCKEEEHT